MDHTLYILHLLGMAAAVGTGFVMLTLGAASSDMDPEARTRFMLRASRASIVSSTGLLLLIVTGVIMAVRYWAAYGSIRTFHIKLGLVVVLIVVFGLMQATLKKAKQEQGGPAMARVPKLGATLTSLGILIIIFAVLSFH